MYPLLTKAISVATIVRLYITLILKFSVTRIDLKNIYSLEMCTVCNNLQFTRIFNLSEILGLNNLIVFLSTNICLYLKGNDTLGLKAGFPPPLFLPQINVFPRLFLKMFIYSNYAR